MDCTVAGSEPEEEQHRCCTEGLGFESSDRVDGGGGEGEEVAVVMRSRMRSMVRRAAEMRGRRFPPPISSLSRNGNPVFVLKPVRRDGRLRMSKVWINRPEILRAECRENRLILFLLVDSEHKEEDEHEEEVEEEEEEIVSCDEGGVVAEEEVKLWRFPLCGNREGFQRCNRNHHHQISLWNHQCLATS